MATPVMAADLPPAGATACGGCHPPSKTADTPPPLAGRKAEQIVVQLQAFRNGQRPATVMDRIAKGVTDEQALAIARWYERQ